MSYVTDNPWPLVIVFGGLAVTFLVIGNTRLRQAAPVLLLAAAGVFVLSKMIVSTAECLQQITEEVLEEFKERDVNGIAAWISPESPELVDTAKQGLERVVIENDFHIQRTDVQLTSDTSAAVRVRANGNVTHRTHHLTQRVSELWDTTWFRESGDWKLTKATRLHPLTGNPIGTFDRH